jgi:hypothetical protein
MRHWNPSRKSFTSVSSLTDKINFDYLTRVSTLGRSNLLQTSVLMLRYSKWINRTWLTLVWQFLNATLKIEQHWVLQVTRERDNMLMDVVLTLNFIPSQFLLKLNLCQMYLQVLTVSDISTADGLCIPRLTDWCLWRILLQNLSTGPRLSIPLGLWTQPPHQQWTWF